MLMNRSSPGPVIVKSHAPIWTVSRAGPGTVKSTGRAARAARAIRALAQDLADAQLRQDFDGEDQREKQDIDRPGPRGRQRRRQDERQRQHQLDGRASSR